MKPSLTLIATLIAGLAGNAHADVVTDWNAKTGGFIAEARLGTPPAVRVIALVQTAAHAAVTAANTSSVAVHRDADAAADAAVATAHRATLVKLMPAQQAAIDAAYQASLAAIAEGPAKSAGIEAGEKAAAEVFAQRADDNPGAAETYRPHTSMCAYVPTVTPAAPNWPQRKPWLMASAAQFRPAAPPALTSEASWASLIDAPMHPEYPSGHGILAGAVGAVLKAEVGAGAMPTLSTASPTAKGTVRRWSSVDDFVQEVADSRIYAGIHFRTATQAGAAMGQRIGELAAAKLLTAGREASAAVAAPWSVATADSRH